VLRKLLSITLQSLLFLAIGLFAFWFFVVSQF
jgi:hypothetical protein